MKTHRTAQAVEMIRVDRVTNTKNHNLHTIFTDCLPITATVSFIAMCLSCRVHIRRTDKLQQEASYHSVKEYMTQVGRHPCTTHIVFYQESSHGKIPNCPHGMCVCIGNTVNFHAFCFASLIIRNSKVAPTSLRTVLLSTSTRFVVTLCDGMSVCIVTIAYAVIEVD